jgi:hypothetical protein
MNKKRTEKHWSNICKTRRTELKLNKIRTERKETLTVLSWVPLAHAYNPTYIEGRDQEDHGSKTLSPKCPTQKRADGLAEVVEHLPRKSKAWV